MPLLAVLRRYLSATHRLHRLALASFVGAPSLLIVALILLSFRTALLATTLSLPSMPDRDSITSSSYHPTPPPPSALGLPPIIYPINLRIFPEGRVLPELAFSPAPNEYVALNGSLSAFFITADGDIECRTSSNPIDVSLHPISSMPSLPDDQDRTSDLGIQELRSNSSESPDDEASVYLILILFYTQIIAVPGLILIYACALGIVFLTTVALYIDRPLPVLKAISYGSFLGMHRLIGFVFLRWVARVVVIQLLCRRFFHHPRAQHMLVELLVKVLFMSFFISPANPWPAPYDESWSVFFFAWPLVDATMSLIVAVVPWVLIMCRDLPRQQGFFLVTLAPAQAITTKVLETLVYWSLGRWKATEAGLITAALLSLAEVYFMVAWVIFYLMARMKYGASIGRPFRITDLQDLFVGLLQEQQN